MAPIEPYQATPPAARQVLNIAELLEHTLSFLPAKDLLAAYDTASPWRNAINASKSLRQLLFLEASTKPTLRLKYVPPAIDLWRSYQSCIVPDGTYGIVELHPLLRHHSHHHMSQFDTICNTGKAIFSSSQSTLSRMLLTEPPVKTVVVHTNLPAVQGGKGGGRGCRHRPPLGACAIEEEGGNTFGRVVEELRDQWTRACGLKRAMARGDFRERILAAKDFCVTITMPKMLCVESVHVQAALTACV